MPGKSLAQRTETHKLVVEKKHFLPLLSNMMQYPNAGIVRSECNRIQHGSDLYAYLACLVRSMPDGCSLKKLKEHMQDFCTDPNRQIQFNPQFPNEWNFALRNVERSDRWPHKTLFVAIEKRPGGNGGRHTGFRILTLDGLVSSSYLVIRHDLTLTKNTHFFHRDWHRSCLTTNSTGMDMLMCLQLVELQRPE